MKRLIAVGMSLALLATAPGFSFYEALAAVRTQVTARVETTTSRVVVPSANFFSPLASVSHLPVFKTLKQSVVSLAQMGPGSKDFHKSNQVLKRLFEGANPNSSLPVPVGDVAPIDLVSDLLSEKFQPGQEISDSAFIGLNRELPLSEEKFGEAVHLLSKRGDLLHLPQGVWIYSAPKTASDSSVFLQVQLIREGLNGFLSQDLERHAAAFVSFEKAQQIYDLNRNRLEPAAADLKKNHTLAEVLKNNAALLLFHDILFVYSQGASHVLHQPNSNQEALRQAKQTQVA
ncbi:MAG: hypothetical protein HY400_00425, partial [Elusimicrobia bacterium]|nr:hypothetical protein [Elusimicrobiota bacterium]